MHTVINEECIYLKKGAEIIRTEYTSICYIEVRGYMIQIVLEGGEVVNQWQSLKEFQNQLPDYFVKISRSKVVNWEKVISVDRKSKTVKLNNNSEHTISVRKLQEILRFL